MLLEHRTLQMNSNYYNFIKYNPLSWFSMAINLRDAACYLDKKAEKGRKEILKATGNAEKYGQAMFELPAIFLIGLAIENLLKGLALKRNPSEDPVKFGHQLLSIYKKTGIQLSREEEYVLNALTEHIVWIGRYKIPKKKERFKLFPLSFNVCLDLFNKIQLEF